MEEWRILHDFPQYAISSIGRIKHLPVSPSTSQDLLHPTLRSGYLSIKLGLGPKRQRKDIHRLVAITFLGLPPTAKHQCNHKNGNKLDNRIENLEWVTQIENARHAYRTGLVQKPTSYPNWRPGYSCRQGELNSNARLSTSDVKYIIQATVEYGGIPKLAEKFNVSTDTIWKIRSRKRWPHISINQ